MSNKPVTILVYLGRGEQGRQRLEKWKQAAEDANVTHCGKPAVGKWLKGLAERETEHFEPSIDTPFDYFP